MQKGVNNNSALIRKKALLGVVSGIPVRVISQSVNFLTLAITARLLRPSDFGIYGLALVIGTLFLTLAESVLSNGLVQREFISIRHLRSAQYASILASLFAVAICIAMSPIMGYIFNNKEISGVLALMSLALPFKFMGAVRIAILQRDLRFQSVQFAALTGVLVCMVLTVMFAMLGFGAYALAIGFISNSVGECLFARYREKKRIKARFYKKEAGEIFEFSRPYLISQLMNFIALQGPMVVIGKMGGSVELGIFNRTYTLQTVPVNLVGGVGGKIVFASISRLQSDEEQLKKILLTSIDLAAKLLLPASIGMALSASLIVNVVLGPQWQVAQSCLTILLAVLFARVGYIIPETMLVAVGRVRNSAKRQAIYACAGLVFSVLGICLYGLTGAVVGVALSIIIFYCTSIMALNYMVKETYFFYVKSHLVGMGIAVPAAMVWFLLHRWLGSGTPEDCISCAAYFVVLLFTYLSLAAKYIGYVYEIKVLLFNTIRRLLARGGAA